MKKFLHLLLCLLLIISTICGCMMEAIEPSSDDENPSETTVETSTADTTTAVETPDTPPVVNLKDESPLEYEIFKSGDNYYLKLIDYESYEYVDHPEGLCYRPVLSFDSFEDYLEMVNNKKKLSINEANAMYLEFLGCKKQGNQAMITSIEEAVIPSINGSFGSLKNEDMSVSYLIWRLRGYEVTLDLGEDYSGTFFYYVDNDRFNYARDVFWNEYFSGGADQYKDKETGIVIESTIYQSDYEYTKIKRFVIQEGNKTVHVVEGRAQTRSNKLEKFDGERMFVDVFVEENGLYYWYMLSNKNDWFDVTVSDYLSFSYDVVKYNAK